MSVIPLKRKLDDGWAERIGRLGFVARAALYAVTGILVLQVALGDWNEQPGKAGAFAAIAEQPLGRLLLGLLAVGLGAYALWLVVHAVFDRGGKGNGITGLARRGGYLVRALWYGGLASFAATRVFGADEPAGSSTERELAGDVMSLPLGRYVVGAFGLGLLGAAGYNGFRAVTLRFEKRLRTRRMNGAERGAARASGVLGHLARMLMFGLIGTFLVRAAWEAEPGEARSLDGAIAELAGEPLGSFVIGALGVGLIAYAAYVLVAARYGKL